MYGNALEIELHVKKQESQLTELEATLREMSALIKAAREALENITQLPNPQHALDWPIGIATQTLAALDKVEE